MDFCSISETKSVSPPLSAIVDRKTLNKSDLKVQIIWALNVLLKLANQRTENAEIKVG